MRGGVLTSWYDTTTYLGELEGSSSASPSISAKSGKVSSSSMMSLVLLILTAGPKGEREDKESAFAIE